MARIITKGLIGVQDLSLGTSTFTRATSTGGSQVLNQINLTSLAGQLTPVLFANLPASPLAGMIAVVSNSNTNTWGATIAGGGANIVLAFYDGTNWTVAGK